MITRPLLAEELESLESVKLPCYVSYKLDGIRCLKVGGKALSRSFKPIPNRFVREYIELEYPDGVDGEIITFTNLVMDDFNTTQSKVMTEEVDPGEFIFYTFDMVTTDLLKPYKDRLQDLYDSGTPFVPQHYVTTFDSLVAIEELAVQEGFEGIMIRSELGKYKCGRSTIKEGILLKYKRFMDSEAIILDILEQETNIGKKEKNELGLTKRSSKKADKQKADTLGEFFVKDVKTGLEFYIGTGQGLTKALRKEIWNNKDSYVGKLIKYKYQPSGQKDLPRFPSWLGFRDERDM